MNVTVQATINANIETVWESWTQPQHVMQWNHASDDWHSPAATNDLQVDGRFCYTMAAKDGSVSFDFCGTYTAVEHHKTIAYTLDDDRKVTVLFETTGSETTVTEIFETENIHPAEMQQAGWQAILNNFKVYTEKI